MLTPSSAKEPYGSLATQQTQDHMRMLAQMQMQGGSVQNSSSVGKYIGVYDEKLISKTINHARDENNSN